MKIILVLLTTTLMLTGMTKEQAENLETFEKISKNEDPFEIWLDLKKMTAEVISQLNSELKDSLTTDH